MRRVQGIPACSDLQHAHSVDEIVVTELCR
jgi:hypothetical protein